MVTSTNNPDAVKPADKGGASWSHLLGPKQVKKPTKEEDSSKGAFSMREQVINPDERSVKSYSADHLSENELNILSMRGYEKKDVVGIHIGLPSDLNKTYVTLGNRYIEVEKKQEETTEDTSKNFHISLESVEKCESMDQIKELVTKAKAVMSDKKGTIRSMTECPECGAHFQTTYGG